MGSTPFGAVIPVTGLNIGFVGEVSRTADPPVIAAHQASATNLLNILFGGPVVLLGDATGGTWQSVADFIIGAGTPSAPTGGPIVVVPMLQSAKLALYQAMREDGLNNVTLARKLHLLEGEVRRMIDLDHKTRIGTLEQALSRLGRQMASEVRRAA